MSNNDLNPRYPFPTPDPEEYINQPIVETREALNKIAEAAKTLEEDFTAAASEFNKIREKLAGFADSIRNELNCHCAECENMRGGKR